MGRALGEMEAEGDLLSCLLGETVGQELGCSLGDTLFDDAEVGETLGLAEWVDKLLEGCKLGWRLECEGDLLCRTERAADEDGNKLGDKVDGVALGR